MIGLRAMRDADLTAVTELYRAYDVAWFGAPEHGPDEVADEYGLAEAACVIEEGGQVLAAAMRSRTGATAVIDPARDPVASAELLVRWLTFGGAREVEVLDRDEVLRAALSAAGWRYHHSSFELLRPLDDGWMPAAPHWPAGVTARRLRAGEEPALHELIYADAGWADVPGHHARDLDEWRRIFLDGRPAEERPIVADADADGRLGGAVLLRRFTDGTGWISQLAVARAQRGSGLGRALLLAGLHELALAGVERLGLSVMGENRSALRLYLDAGLPVDREWQLYAAPTGPDPQPDDPLPAQTGGSA